MLENSPIYKSFTKKNKKEYIHHIHYNRNYFSELEKEFEEKYGFQYEYILYKIFLTEKKIDEINSDYIIYSDSNDVVCNEEISKIDIPEDYILFSHEKHKYPNNMVYKEFNESNSVFLNSGLFMSTKNNYKNMLNTIIENIICNYEKNYGGDQGVFSTYYIRELLPFIKLDLINEFFLSTYLCNLNDFEKIDLYKIKSKKTDGIPLFIHDNGWNYGSPKFIENFNLL
jgi:hypothetical protein